MSKAIVAAQDTAPVPAEPVSILAVIERAALNPEIDVDKMERLLSMHERIVAKQAEAAFNAAMTAAQAEMPRVLRDATNDQTRSTYARLETVNAKIIPVATKHGLSLSFGTADPPAEGLIRITLTVAHIQGHSRLYHVDVPLDLTGMKGNQNKTATHAFGSTISYGRRYLTLLAFNISVANEDVDGNQPGDTITDEQVLELEDLIRSIGGGMQFDKFLEFARIPNMRSLHLIPARDYRRVKASLESKWDQVRRES